MPAYGYEFYLLVVNLISHEWAHRVDHSKIKFISTRGHVISSISFFYFTTSKLHRGYYTLARRYEFSGRVARTISHSNIKVISSSWRVMFFLLCRHTNDSVFDDFPKISDDFPKIFQNCSKRTLPNISENVRRFSKIDEDFRGRLGDVSIIHQRI